MQTEIGHNNPTDFWKQIQRVTRNMAEASSTTIVEQKDHDSLRDVISSNRLQI